MSYEYFYPGTSYPLNPEYGDLFTGYNVPFSEIGAPTSIQTANQIQEVTNRLSEGVKTIELQPISAGVFDTIPKQHLKEINRLTKLTGAETTLHAPMIDPAGFSKEGWSEAGREEAERELKEIVERSHELSPEGNMPVTIHASAIPGTEYSKPSKKLIDDYKKQLGRELSQEEMKQLEESRIIAINQETGQLAPMQREERFYPEKGGEKEIYTPERTLDVVNTSEWSDKLLRIQHYTKEADELQGDVIIRAKPILMKINLGQKLTREEEEMYGEFRRRMEQSDSFRRHAFASLNSAFDQAWKYSDKEGREKLKEAAVEYKKLNTEIEERSKHIGRNQEEIFRLGEKESEAMSKLTGALSSIKKVKLYTPIEDFAVEKASETLGNVAFNAYDKFKDKAPIISIENLYPGMAFSRSEELKKLVEETRKKFVEKAKKEGYSEGEAEDAAKKLIGVTWDVGHLNMLRKSGFTEEEIAKETEKIGGYVKHVHLTDNFGYADTHLPPGMGNVPIKDILKELEKAGFKGKKIIEAGAFVQHFKVSPTQYVLEALGSPLYGAMMQPYWNQISSMYGSYFGGYGTIMPEQHFSMYGAGFSALPTELGGQIPGKQSRFAGAPNA